jgi:hypothetical protein
MPASDFRPPERRPGSGRPSSFAYMKERQQRFNPGQVVPWAARAAT